MQEYFYAFILGLVEGITEFLPVSSTYHLRITQALLGISLEDSFWKLFSVVVQLGGVLAIYNVYFSQINRWTSEFFGFSGSKRLEITAKHPLVLLAISFACTVLPVLLLERWIGSNLENLRTMSFAMIGGAFVMAAVDWMSIERKFKEVHEISPLRAAIVGVLQVFSALFPGTSRSMVTLLAGMAVGMNRKLAVEYSFLLSIPVIGAASAYDLLKYLLSDNKGVITLQQSALLAVGMVTAFGSAKIVVEGFLRYVQTGKLWPFVVYRILVGSLVLFFLVK